MDDFLRHLKQRKLVQWALAYAAGAWALLQVIEMASGSYGWPVLVMRVAFGVVALGFLVTLLLAWYHGERGEQKFTGTELVILAVLLAVGGAVIWRSNSHAPETPGSVATTATQIAGTPTATVKTATDKSVAVLPFENLSSDKDNAYFADGIQDQILTGLAKISDLKVISRTSTLRYASKPENLSDIARQLGVANILEGSVQKSGNRVRINVQLIRADSDSHLWAETYDRTLDDIFAVESEVAEKIAESLAANLTRGERTALAQKPTDNPAAYAAYLKARAMTTMITSSRQEFDRALAGYREAVTLDPKFALAWAELSREVTRAGWTGLDPSGALKSEARLALARAKELMPELPQAEMARGVMLYYDERDFPGALVAMDTVTKELPGDAEGWMFSGFIARRLGMWDRALADLQHARSLAPNDANIAYNVGTTLVTIREFERAIPVFDANLKLLADNPGALAIRQQCLWSLGDMGKAGKVLADIDADTPVVLGLRALQALYQRDYAEAAKLYRRALASGTDIQTDLNANGYIPARIDWQLQLALSEQLSGAQANAREIYSEVRYAAMSALAAKPNNLNIEVAWRAELGLALAGLGQREEADAQARRFVALIPDSVDKVDGPAWQDYAARIYALSGDAKQAVALAEHLFQTNGSFLTAPLLRVDPAWDPIRNDAGFQALLEKHAGHGAAGQ